MTAGQPGRPAQLVHQRLPLGLPGGGVEDRPRPGRRQPGPAGRQVQRGDVAAGCGQQCAQVVQAAAVAQPGPLGARLEQPVVAVPGQRPLVGRRDQALEQAGEPERPGELAGPAASPSRLCAR